MKHLRLILSVFLLALFAGGSVYAEKIPQSRAIQVASNFFKNNGHIQQNMVVLKTSEDLPSLATKGFADEPKFYIIGNPSGKGFAIISADTRFRQVLGYSFEHSFSTGDIPSNIENWFVFLREQMEWAEKNNITDPVAIAEWKGESKVGKVVKELSTPLWHQGTPYNNECPMDGKSKSLTGCVATAVCEVMRYHSWPVSGNGITEEYTCESGVKVSSRNLNHTYDWENMPFTQAEINSDVKRAAIANLMADVGAAFHLNYSKNGTGGYTYEPALVNNFGYSPTIVHEYRKNYTDDGWIKCLKKDINNDLPIIHSGHDTNGAGGHAFVIDGYDDKDYFHVNWGWGGSSNGYFLVSALNPGEYKFNNYQHAIFGVKPGDGTFQRPEHWLDLYSPGLNATVTEFSTYEQFKISATIINTSVLDFIGNLAMFVVDKKENKIEKIAEFSNVSLYDLIYHTFLCKITKDIKKGYRIRAFYKPSGTEEWYPMWRDDANPSLKQEILIAEEGYPLEDLCSFYMTATEAKVTVPSGTETSLMNSGTEVTTGVTKTETTISVDISKLTPGTKYHFHLVKDDETKDLYFTSKPIEK